MKLNDMRVSARGITLTALREGLKLVAYPDPDSSNGIPWTIGHGHTRGVKRGDKCTGEQARAWLIEDLEIAVKTVKKLVKVDLNQDQYNALVSFVFNIGEPQFAASTMLKLINQGKFNDAANQFDRWIYNDGKVSNGLVNRRRNEKAEFLGQLA